MNLSSIYILLFAFILNSCGNSDSANIKLAPNEAMPNEANLQDWERTKNPALGYPTPEKLIPILNQVSAYKAQANKVPGQSGYLWSERGPFDTGGRTRAIMFDPNDASAKKVWAGGVTGGLWYNNDITSATSSWQNVDDFWSNLTITCIAYDPNNTSTFYVGTGESFTNASRGAGIWKSTDGGATWAQISSTSQFYYVNDIAVRDESGTSAVLAAITNGYYQGVFPTGGSANAGLQRSNNGGTTWTQVLPNIPGQSAPAAASDIEIDAANNVWIGSNASPYSLTDRGGGRIYKSTNGTAFTSVYAATVTNGYGRVELACAPSDANYVYAIVENVGKVHEIVKTTNAGTSWSNVSEPADVDNGIPSTDFTRGQARYDLIAAVNPTDKNQVLVGGIDLFRTIDGGTSWNHISKWSNNNDLALLTCAKVHADQHQLVFRPGFPNQLVNGNDGGVYFCTDITQAQTTSAFEVRNRNYNVTQFYANAMSPAAGANVHLAGSQDNGTQYFKKFGKASTSEFTGGDGAYCFVDQNEPNVLISSYVRNNYYYSLDGGNTEDDLLVKNSGSFINPAAYDYNLNILYSTENSSSINRTVLPETQGPLGTNAILPLALGTTATTFTVSQHTTASTTLFIGTSGGSLFKVTNANGGSPALSNITGASFPSGATINNVWVGSSELELVAVFSNYGVSSIWYTSNGGISWSAQEGALPDMPIRWFMRNPNNIAEAIVATEVGVWRTANFTNTNPTWVPSTSGLANVRVDMLQMRSSDKQVSAATYGRGLFTSDAFSEQAPVALFSASTLYSAVSAPVFFTDQSAALPTSWSWTITPTNYTLLNGSTLSSQNPEVAFTQTGTYTVSLTATNSYGNSTAETKTNYISVNTSQSIPYDQNFDSFTDAPDKGNDCSNVDPLSANWINLPNSLDDSDWLTDASGTASSDTGPSNDHTTGTTGNYLYTESSACSYATKILYSPNFDFVNKSADMLTFYNHMYGSSMGTLNLYARQNGSRDLIWSQSGDQSNQWNTVQLDISDYNGTYVQFEFEGINVDNFTSDMAIDDFKITELTPLILWDGGASTTQWTDASNWDTDVVPTSTDKVILDNTHVSGNYTVNLSASHTIKDLEIDLGANTVTLSGGDGLNVAGVVSPTSGTIISNGQLTLKATTSNDYGQIAVGSGTISGNVVNEWYFSGANGMRHIASPVTCNLSGLSDDFNTINFTSDATGSIWAWNASTSEWITPSGGSSSSFNQGISVFCGSSSGAAFSTLPLTIDALGPIVSGNQAQSLSFSSGSGPDFENGADGWNFVYNPYPSTIQWSLVAAGAYPAELASTYYYWDANSGLEGAYASYNPSTATSVNGATNFITKGRAFWVQASSAPSSALSFTDAMRTAEETPSMKTQSDGVSNQITLTANSNSFDDNAYYGEFLGATKKYDPAFDHLKMSGTSDASIYIENEARKLAYNTVSKYQYPLPFKVLAKNTGKIEIGVSLADDFFGDEPRFIQNLTTGKIHDLQDGDLEISTSANKEYAFLLLHVKTDAKDNITPFTYTRKGIIGVNLMQSEVYTKIEVLDISGRLVESANIQKNAQHVELQIKKSGTFIIRLSSPRGAQFIEKVVLIN